MTSNTLRPGRNGHALLNNSFKVELHKKITKAPISIESNLKNYPAGEKKDEQSVRENIAILCRDALYQFARKYAIEKHIKNHSNVLNSEQVKCKLSSLSKNELSSKLSHFNCFSPKNLMKALIPEMALKLI